jgi:hypothetical protein
MGCSSDPLRNLKVASPCPASWDAMYGDDRVRYCGECRLNVYNISGMTRVEAERLIASKEGRLCVRFYRRADGTVLTKDCPVGLAAVRRRMARVASAVAGFVFGILTGTGATLALREAAPDPGYGRTMGTIAVPVGHDPVVVQGDVAPTMGAVGVTPPRAEPTTRGWHPTTAPRDRAR